VPERPAYGLFIQTLWLSQNLCAPLDAIAITAN
jgi:hypothetical protein